jgi:hypothetical protein
VYGPLVAAPAVGVNVQLPWTMLPATKVALDGTEMMVLRLLMELTVTPDCDVGTTWLPPGTDIVKLVPWVALAGVVIVSDSCSWVHELFRETKLENVSVIVPADADVAADISPTNPKAVAAPTATRRLANRLCECGPADTAPDLRNLFKVDVSSSGLGSDS